MLYKVLLIDDENVVLSLFETWLNKAGYLCQSGKSVNEAIDYLKQENFDLVITDINMPVASGVELLRWCRKTERSIPFIMVTGKLEAELTAEALNLGARHLLKKPLKRQEFLQSVQMVIKEEAMQKESKKSNHSYSTSIQNYIDEISRYHVLFMACIDSFAAAIGERDGYTLEHSTSVSHLAVSFGKALGLGVEECEQLRISGELHDIGKIGVPESILLKPGKLDEQEFEIMKSHSLRGAKILESLPDMKWLCDDIMHHHEAFNGSGYPHRLYKDDISFHARILSICDVWDALSSDRPYRLAMPRDKAIFIMQEGRSCKFDPELLDFFLGKVISLPDPLISSSSQVLS